MNQLRLTAFSLLALATLAPAPLLHAQDVAKVQDVGQAQDGLPKLTADERKSLAAIRPQDVRGILSFLASDELKGRNTPSPELNIAAAYVASRFRAAGLEGLGPKGSYYLEHELTARQLPSLGVVALDGKGNPIPNYGLVSTNGEPFEWKGALAGSNSDDAKGSPILLDAPANLRGRMSRMPAGYLVVQASKKARDKKASAILMRVPKDHALVQLSAKARKVNSDSIGLSPERNSAIPPSKELPTLRIVTCSRSES